MIYNICLMLVSLVFLLVSADWLVSAIVDIAKRFQVSTMVIGLTVVAIGTSLPELASSLVAAYEGHPGIAIGNVLGSNICNVGLILGLPALIAPIVVKRTVITREGGIMLFATAVFWGLSAGFGYISQTVGGLFVLGFGAFVYFVYRTNTCADADQEWSEAGDDALIVGHYVIARGLSGIAIKLISSFVVLILSSDLLVGATVSVATSIGVSETIIALSVIALGTSLPELSVSLVAVKKKQGDILVGNIIGSNVSNILLVIGAAAMVEDLPVEKTSVMVDFPLTAMFSLLMVLFLSTSEGITRGKGILLLALYVAVIVRVVMFG